jgi:hypothetical protein
MSNGNELGAPIRPKSLITSLEAGAHECLLCGSDHDVVALQQTVRPTA